MEKTMNTNKITIYVTIIAILLIISVPTIYKVVKTNHEKLYLVTEKLVIENAEKCIYEKKCNKNKVTLRDLYEKGYLKDEVIDPVSKTVYSKESYVLIKKDSSTFYPTV